MIDNCSNYVFIPGNIPSLKNSKQWTGKYLVKSNTVNNFLKSFGIKNYSSSKKTVDIYSKSIDTFKPYIIQLKNIIGSQNVPYKLRFYFVRKTKSRFDFGNAVEIISDMFTAYDLWDDDNCDNFLPFPWIIDNSCYKVDKDNPGVYISVFE